MRDPRRRPVSGESGGANLARHQCTRGELATDDIWFIDSQRGWAVNSNGQILHTEDGFTTWEQQFHDPQVYFRGVGFASESRGWIGTLTHVRQVLDESQPAPGPRSVNWDATDDDGQPQAEGSFILRVTVDGHSESQIVHINR